MTKRTDSIRAMFAAGGLSADNPPAIARSSAGSVRSIRETFSEVERENEELRSRLADGGTVDLDPGLVDPSPLADRFEDQDEASFSALKASIAERGQLIPVLVRPHPSEPGRYQSAYGHRRVRAARALGVMVKAQVQDLADEELAVAQGVENSAREDLSFIERAVFAAKLEDAGLKRILIQTALAIDKAEASKLLSVARVVPPDIVAAVGRAPRVGRSRWQALAEALKDAGSARRAAKAIALEGFLALPSDDRFALVAKAISGSAKPAKAGRAGSVATREGRVFARYRLRGGTLTMDLERGSEHFLTFLVDELPDLLERYQASKKSG